jgi:hypothetical protein
MEWGAPSRQMTGSLFELFEEASATDDVPMEASAGATVTAASTPLAAMAPGAVMPAVLVPELMIAVPITMREPAAVDPFSVDENGPVVKAVVAIRAAVAIPAIRTIDRSAEMPVRRLIVPLYSLVCRRRPQAWCSSQ